jgi:hypothetical protein
MMSTSTLRRILAFARANPADPIISIKPVSERLRKISEETRRARLWKNPNTTAAKLKRAAIAALANVSIWPVQEYCLKDLQPHSRRKATQPSSLTG